jgi:fermentation-respiration switch protein FrsA (DUF1100 family)
LVLEVEKGLDRLHGRQPGDRLAKEAERTRPPARDIDENTFEEPDELLGCQRWDSEHRQQAAALGSVDIDALSLERPDVLRSYAWQRKQHARLARLDAVPQKRKTQAKTAGIGGVEAPQMTPKADGHPLQRDGVRQTSRGPRETTLGGPHEAEKVILFEPAGSPSTQAAGREQSGIGPSA